MKRTIPAVFAAAALAFGLGLTVSAQSNSSAYQSDNNNQKPITVTGCLQQTESGGYYLTHAQMTNGSQSQSQSSTESNEATRSGSENQATMGSTTNAWNLRGDHSDQWKDNVGKKVQVTGTPQSTMSGDKLKTGESTSSTMSQSNGEIQARDFTVTGNVRVLASSCQ